MMRSFLLKVKSKSGVVETMTPSTLNLNDFEALVVASDYSTQDRHQTYPTVIFIPKGSRRSSSTIRKTPRKSLVATSTSDSGFP